MDADSFVLNIYKAFRFREWILSELLVSLAGKRIALNSYIADNFKLEDKLKLGSTLKPILLPS
jgi:hypothetical protein